MPRSRGRRVAKKDVPVDILRVVARNARRLRESQAAHSEASVAGFGEANPSSAIVDTPPILDPVPASPILDPGRFSAMNDLLPPGSASPPHFDPELPIACRPLTPSTGIPTSRHSLGPFNVVCSSCGALHWMEERLKRSSPLSPQFGMCCNSGALSFPSFPDPPQPLLSLLDGHNMTSGISHLRSNFPFRADFF